MLFRTTPGGGLVNISASIQTSKGGDPGQMGALVGRLPRRRGGRIGDVVVTGGGTLLPPTAATGFAIPVAGNYGAKAQTALVAPVAFRTQSPAQQASAAAAIVSSPMQKAVIHGALGPSNAPTSGSAPAPMTAPTNDPAQSPTPTATYLNQQAAASASASGSGASAAPAAAPLSPSQLGFSTSDTSDSSVSPQDPGSTTAAGATASATPTAAVAATPAASSPSTGLYVGVSVAALAAGIGLYLAVR